MFNYMPVDDAVVEEGSDADQRQRANKLERTPGRAVDDIGLGGRTQQAGTDSGQHFLRALFGGLDDTQLQLKRPQEEQMYQHSLDPSMLIHSSSPPSNQGLTVAVIGNSLSTRTVAAALALTGNCAEYSFQTVLHVSTPRVADMPLHFVFAPLKIVTKNAGTTSFWTRTHTAVQKLRKMHHNRKPVPHGRDTTSGDDPLSSSFGGKPVAALLCVDQHVDPEYAENLINLNLLNALPTFVVGVNRFVNPAPWSSFADSQRQQRIMGYELCTAAPSSATDPAGPVQLINKITTCACAMSDAAAEVSLANLPDAVLEDAEWVSSFVPSFEHAYNKTSEEFEPFFQQQQQQQQLLQMQIQMQMQMHTRGTDQAHPNLCRHMEQAEMRKRMHLELRQAADTKGADPTKLSGEKEKQQDGEGLADNPFDLFDKDGAVQASMVVSNSGMVATNKTRHQQAGAGHQAHAEIDNLTKSYNMQVSVWSKQANAANVASTTGGGATDGPDFASMLQQLFATALALTSARAQHERSSGDNANDSNSDEKEGEDDEDNDWSEFQAQAVSTTTTDEGVPTAYVRIFDAITDGKAPPGWPAMVHPRRLMSLAEQLLGGTSVPVVLGLLSDVDAAYRVWTALRNDIASHLDVRLTSDAVVESMDDALTELVGRRNQAAKTLRQALVAAQGAIDTLSAEDLQALADKCYDAADTWTKHASELAQWLRTGPGRAYARALVEEYNSQQGKAPGTPNGDGDASGDGRDDDLVAKVSRQAAATTVLAQAHTTWKERLKPENLAAARTNRTAAFVSALHSALTATASGNGESGDFASALQPVYNEGASLLKQMRSEAQTYLAFDAVDGVPVLHALEAAHATVKVFNQLAEHVLRCAHLGKDAQQARVLVERVGTDQARQLAEAKANALVRKVVASKKLSRNFRRAQVDLDEAKEAVTFAEDGTAEAQEASQAETDAKQTVHTLQVQLYQREAACRSLRAVVYREVMDVGPELIFHVRGLKDAMLIRGADAVLSTSGIFSESMSLESSFETVELMAGRGAATANMSEAIGESAGDRADDAYSAGATGGNAIASGDAETSEVTGDIVHALNQVYKCKLLKRTGPQGGSGGGKEEMEDAEKDYVCVKQYDQGSANQMRHLQRQLRLLHDLRHFNLVQLNAVFADSRRVFVVFPYLAGGTLADVIRDDTADASWRKQLFVDVLSALVHLHSHNIVHCDVKPANVFVSLSTGRALLGDFDACRQEMTDAAGLATTSVFAAQLTKKYAAVEVLQQLEKNDARTAVAKLTTRADMFSAGVVLRELFENVSLDSEDAGALADLLRLLTSVHPEERPSAAQCLEWTFFRWSMSNAQASAAQRLSQERLREVTQELDSLQAARDQLDQAKQSSAAEAAQMREQLAARETQLREQQTEIEQQREKLQQQQKRLAEATERQQRELQELREQHKDSSSAATDTLVLPTPLTEAVSNVPNADQSSVMSMFAAMTTQMAQMQQAQAAQSQDANEQARAAVVEALSGHREKEDVIANSLAGMQQQLTGLQRRQSSRLLEQQLRTGTSSQQNSATEQVAQEVQELKRLVQSVLDTQVGLASKQAEVVSLVRELVHSETDTPNYPCLLPADAVKDGVGKLGALWSRHVPSSVFRKRFRLFFVCPVTGLRADSGPDGDGFEITQPRNWVARLAPVLERTAQVLRVAGTVAGAVLTAGASLAGSAAATAMAMGRDSSGHKEETQLLADLTDGIVQSVLQTTEETDGQDVRASSSQGVTGDEYQQLLGLLKSVDAGMRAGAARPTQTGLVRVTGGSGTEAITLWVHPRAESQFAVRGRAMLRRDVFS